MLMLSAAIALVGDGAVPLEAVGVQGAEDQVNRAFLCAWWVNILDAQQPPAIVDACFQIAGNGRQQGAKM